MQRRGFIWIFAVIAFALCRPAFGNEAGRGGPADAAVERRPPDAAAATEGAAAVADGAAEPDGAADGGASDGIATDAGSVDAARPDSNDDAALDAGVDAPPEASARDADAGTTFVEVPGDPTSPAPGKTTDLLLKTMVGLTLVVFLAYLGSRPRVRRFEQRLGLTQLITAGFPFILLGVLLRLTGVFKEAAIVQMTPLLQFGLGWLGFVVGYRFDVRFLDRVPPGTAMAVGLATALPFAAISVTAAVLMLAFGWATGAPTFLRDAIALGAAGAMTATRVGPRPKTKRGITQDLPRRIAELDEIAGVVGLAFIAAYFRPDHAQLTWDLTGTAWLFITLGMGVAIGMVLYVALSQRSSGSEFLAAVLGSVAFAAGMASYLHLSPLVVCFLVGALVTNLPFRHKDQLEAILRRLEHPILLLFLTVAGALWELTDWRGWVLVPVFVVVRIIGKGAVVAMLRARSADLPTDKDSRLVIAPLSVLSIAIVLGMQGLYRESSVPWIVTAVIAGAFVTEVLTRIVNPKPSGDGPEPSR